MGVASPAFEAPLIPEKIDNPPTHNFALAAYWPLPYLTGFAAVKATRIDK
jgi:hypothetical protein